MMLGALARMLSVMEPNRNWKPLARVYNHLRRTAAPSRDKLARLIAASDLFTLGLRLMDTCEEGPDGRCTWESATATACPSRS